MLAVFLLLPPPVSPSGAVLFHSRDRRLELLSRKAFRRRLGRIDVYRNQCRNPSGALNGGKPRCGRHTRGHIPYEIVSDPRPGAGDIADRLVDKRHERGVAGEIVPCVVQIRRHGDQPAATVRAVDDRRFASRETRDDVAGAGIDAADAAERGEAQAGAASTGEDRMTRIAGRKRSGRVATSFGRSHRQRSGKGAGGDLRVELWPGGQQYPTAALDVGGERLAAAALEVARRQQDDG